MRSKFKWIFSLLLALSMQLVFAQVKTVSGTVTDQTGAVPGVNIVISGTRVSTQTGFDGKYSIKAKQGDVLVFSFLGMDTVKMNVGVSSTLDVKMKDTGAQNLEEVVVVAYGKTKKSSYTGSATAVLGEALEGRSVTNVLSGLEGAVSGVQIQSAAGQPGSSPTIRIRGFSSINGSNTPLYILDGVPFTGDLSSINAADISSMTVLKDAASTSLYGSKAANGVVMITTKTGKSTKEKFTLNISTGLSSRSIPEYQRVDAFQYYPLIWEAVRNSRNLSTPANIAAANAYASANTPIFLVENPFNVPNNSIVGLDGKINPNAKLLYADDLDWEKKLSRAGVRKSVDFSYQGKTEKTDYFASLSNLDEEGNIKGSQFRRATARLNINTKHKEWFKTGINLTGVLSESNNAVDGVDNTSSFNNPFRTIRYMGPIFSVYKHNPDGSVILDGIGNPVYSDIRASDASNGRNVVYETLNNIDKDKSMAINARAYAEFKFLKDFSFKTNVAIDRTSINNSVYWNPVISDAAPDGLSAKENSVLSGITFNQILDYNKTINGHNFSALLGHESFDYEFNFLTGTKRKLISANNTEFINFVTTSDLNSYTRNYATESYFSRIGYDYLTKYIISGSFRRDGSSKFAKDNRWGNFWSVGLAWVVSNENFLKDSEWINDFKIRGSRGEVGNDSHISNGGLNYYVSQPTFSNGFSNGSEGGFVANGPGAADLKWEKNTQSDIGIEFTLFKNRLKGSVEYYKRETDGLIFNVPNPLTSGLDNRVENIGSMFNSGIEVSLDVTLIKTQDFSWNFNVNASTIKNEITKLPQSEIITGTKKYSIGSSIFDYWLRDWYGVDPTDGYALYVIDPNYLPANGAVDPTYRVVNGVNVTTDQNKALFHYADTSLPDLFGSFTNSFKYGGFQLDVLVAYQLGGKTYDSNYASLMHTGVNYGSALSTDILGRWQKPGDVTDVPRLDVNRNVQSSAASDRWLVDSDYLSLRQITMSYNLPSKFVGKIGVDGIRFFANGENLMLFTKRVGLDPTQNLNGTTQNRFSPARLISLGLNLNF
ncbi:SusC/RagA family TonB-linked outer membrane protein [Flavobacterium succinicans]|uniref:TonB-dependent receptor SusC n=1 Tax=Flavobacterium succinicans TaxID=29536 RepID=A0A199XP13_9FLAO|nr:SusC/RagA family TonB-linked outer membrane protein [Flavobacterium succinicans]OAZ03478.1 TonB-dependent receptor SusC precursor [Flavobacterium succinicans]